MSDEARQKFAVGSLGLGIVGLGLSAYATYHHILLKMEGQTDAICNINAKLNCDHVASSPYSEIFNIPVAILGLGYFLGAIIMAGTVLINHKSAKENTPALPILYGIGVAVSLVLGGISTLVLKSWCIICIGVYAVCLLQAGWAWLNRPVFAGYSFKAKTLIDGLTTAFGAVVVTVLLFNVFGPQPNPSRAARVATKDLSQNGAGPEMLGAPVNIPINRSAYSGLGEDYRKGSDSARIVLVEFSDLQCPACAEFHKVAQQISAHFGDRVSFVFKNFPLDSKCNRGVEREIHAQACLLASMARCAGQNGKFWEYAQKAYEGQRGVDAAKAKGWAKEIGLSDEQIKTCESSPDFLAKIKDDVSLGLTANVDGTPALFINGKKYFGSKDFESLKAIIEKML